MPRTARASVGNVVCHVIALSDFSFSSPAIKRSAHVPIKQFQRQILESVFTARGAELYTRNREVARRLDCKSFSISGLREQIFLDMTAARYRG